MVMNSTRGLMILVKLHKHESRYDDVLTMSFYLTLTSDGCRDAFPNNHGGDFMVQLEHTLDMRGHDWEVALVDMMYTGQAFPNLPVEDSEVRLQVSGKPTFENDYIITYDQTVNLWLKFDAGRRAPSDRNEKSTWIIFPRQHYSWTSFIETLRTLCYEQFKMADLALTDKEFRFTEKNMTLDVVFKMDMSKDFTDLFGIDTNYKQIHDHINRWVHFKHTITKMPKVQSDSSTLFYSPYARRKDCRLYVNGQEIFKLTNQYWTTDMFKRAINAVGKKLPKDLPLLSLAVEDGSNPDQFKLVFTADNTKKGDSETISITMSSDFGAVFQTTANLFTASFTEPQKILLSIRVADEEDRSWRTFEASGRLKNNFYPDISSLVIELNQVLDSLQADIAKRRNSSTKAFTFFNSQANIVTFSGKEGCTLILSSNMLKLLHLPNKKLTTSETGTMAVVMKTYKRSHLYVHLDCLDYHYINNQTSNLLKVLPNSAAIDEKLQLTFSDPHYYAVSKRYLSTINMYITDSYFDGILQFDRDIAYTLHFRRCAYL
jgi:hypothetical protein